MKTGWTVSAKRGGKVRVLGCLCHCEQEHAPWCPQACFCSKIEHFTGLYRPAPLSFIFMIFSDSQTFWVPIPFNFPASFRTLPKPEIAEMVAKPTKRDTLAVRWFVYMLRQLPVPQIREFSSISQANPVKMGIVGKLEARRIWWCWRRWSIQRIGDFMPCWWPFSFIFNI